MSLLWIFCSISAAFFQNLRSLLQKEIKDTLSNAGSAYVRFFYAVPFAIILWLFGRYITDAGFVIDGLNVSFLFHCFFGGIAQVLFTVLLLWTFSFRSFAVGTTFSKMEVIFIAILSYPLLGDTLSLNATIAILVGCFGAILLSQSGDAIRIFSLSGMREKSTWIGLASGLFLGLSSIFYRAAILELETGNFVMRALSTLTVALMVQTFLMGLWFLIFDRRELLKVLVHWRRALPIGIIGMITSLFWFCAFALQKPSFVRAVGQIELVFAFLSTIFFFRERVRFHELAGVFLIVVAILTIILFG